MLALPALVASCWLAAAPGKAPSVEETRLFDEGMRAFQAGNPREAEKAWRAGFALGKDPAFLVRMGEAQEKAGQPAEAADSYRRYLRAAPDAADRAEIEQRIARLAPGSEGAPAAGATPPAGAETPGAFGAGASGSSPAAVAPPAAARATTAAARDDETADRQRGDGDGEERGWTPYNVTAWAATGAAVLLLGVSGYYAASAGSDKDDVNLLLRYQNPDTGAPLEYQTVAARYQNAISAGQRDDRRAKDALYVAAGAAVVATTFFILDSVMRAPDGHHAQGEPAPRRQVPRMGLQIAPVRPGEAAAANGTLTGVSALSWLRWSF